MTLTATYASDLSRVRLVVASAPAAADNTKFERSVDQITWTTVRGGSAVALSSAACHLDDYEFVPNVPNFYRASYVDTAGPAGIAVGTAATGNNASVTPPLPAGPIPGDLLMILASIRNSGAGTVNVPTGWTLMFAFGNMALLGRRYVTGDAAPAVTFSGGVANADTMAQMALFRNTELTPTSALGVLNASAQNVAWPGLTLTATSRCVLQLMWKQDDLTSVATPATASPIGTMNSTAGDDASTYWSALFVVPPAPPSPAGSFVVTGGAAAISRGALVALQAAAFVTQDTASLTPTLADSTGVQRLWIKNIQRPYLNTALSTPLGKLSITRPARAGVFDVVRRGLPVAVTDLRGSKEFTIGALVVTDVERDRLDLILTAGEPILLHVPPNIRLKSLYATIGDETYDDEASSYTLPLKEVAAPPSTIVGVTILYSDIEATFATYAAVRTAYATYAAVMDSIGSPTDIITG